jgi:two-component sensor histidine kinase
VKGWKLLDRQSYFGLTRRQLQTLYLVAATGLAALVPLIFFAGYWIQSELGKNQREIDAFLGARAAALSQRIDVEIERQLAALHALAALPSLDQDVERFETAAGRVTGAMPQWSALSLAAGDGRVIFSTGRGEPVVDPALVKRAIAEKRALIETTPPGEGRPGGILLYEPVVREHAAAHVFVLTFGPGSIQTTLAHATGQDLSSMVIDAHGRILAGSGASDDALGKMVEPDVARSIAAAPSGRFGHAAHDGESLTTAFTRSALTGWTSLVSISRNRSENLFTRPLWATVAAGALSLLLAGILAVFITHNVMERRVSEERLAASRALGELDARLLATSQEALIDQRKAASEREVLLREIYHRVKNNLQIVQSLLRLGSRDLLPEQREPFESAVRRIGAMARVHTLLYNSPDLASIDFRDYLDELLRELAEGFGADDRAIESILKADPMRMPLDTAVPLAFIAVEILTNAFKHAFPPGRSGRITVDVHREGDKAVLRIADDGVGVNVDPAVKRRLGLTIVRKLVQQIGGELEEPPPGASAFIIRFPIEGASAPAPVPVARP